MFNDLLDMLHKYKADLTVCTGRHYSDGTIRFYIKFVAEHDDVKVEFSKWGEYGDSLDVLADEAVQKVRRTLTGNVASMFSAPLLEAPAKATVAHDSDIPF